MSDVSIADLRASLEAERDSLRHQLDDLGFGGGVGHQFDSNFADSSQVTAERGEVEALGGKLKETLDDVEYALQKIESGDFGTCESCGQPIPMPRLEAMPAARFCIDCASKQR